MDIKYAIAYRTTGGGPWKIAPYPLRASRTTAVKLKGWLRRNARFMAIDLRIAEIKIDADERETV